MQGVSGSAGHHHACQPDTHVVDQVQPRGSPPAPEVLGIGTGVDAAHRDDEADAVHRGHQTAAPVVPGQGNVGLSLDQRGVGGGNRVRPQVALVDVADAVRIIIAWAFGSIPGFAA